MSNRRERRGFLLVLSSPSGGGKTTIYEALLKKGEPFEFSVSATTRPPRESEIDGVHYRFVSDSQFDRMITEAKFAEWAVVHNHRYGTPKSYVDQGLAQGKVMIFEIDVQGAAQLKTSYPDDTVLVFIAPPSLTETERRLSKRETNSDEDIALRLKNAKKEIRQFIYYDYLVINDDLDEAIEDIMNVVRAESLKSARFMGKVWPENDLI